MIKALNRKIISPKGIDDLDKILTRLIMAGVISLTEADNVTPDEIPDMYNAYMSVMYERANLTRSAIWAKPDEWKRIMRQNGGR